jgi:hypothetical protein
MTSATFVILSGALSFGAPIAFAVYEIVALRRRRGGGDDRDPPAMPVPRPLPDCLQPKVLLSPRKLRELQDA